MRNRMFFSLSYNVIPLLSLRPALSFVFYYLLCVRSSKSNDKYYINYRKFYDKIKVTLN